MTASVLEVSEATEWRNSRVSETQKRTSNKAKQIIKFKALFTLQYTLAMLYIYIKYKARNIILEVNS